jgi:hypothetical protein
VKRHRTAIDLGPSDLCLNLLGKLYGYFLVREPLPLAAVIVDNGNPPARLSSSLCNFDSQFILLGLDGSAYSMIG